MSGAEKLHPQKIIRSAHPSDACSLAVTANSITQPIVDRLGLDESLNERLTVLQRKLQPLMFFDSASCCVLHA